MKNYLAIVKACVVLGAVVALYYAVSSFNPFSFLERKSTTVVLAELQETRAINTLHTGVSLIPILDVSTKKQDTKDVPRGYCRKKYEVSIGYEDIMEILSNDAYRNAVCSGNIDELPSPHILGAWSIDSEQNGDYGGPCGQLDLYPKERDEILIRELQKTKVAEQMVEQSKKSLGSFVKLLCN